MICEQCEQQAISTKPAFCKNHFDNYLLDTVSQTIEEYSLFTKEQTICVGISGGKDSLALADILLRLGYKVEGLFINEGIANYREQSIEDIDLFIQRTKIPIRRVSFEEEAGFQLDTVMKTKKFHACTVCGTLRRHLLNKYAHEYDVIATGHNMDDEAQTILMNLARGNTSLFLRTGPKTLKNKYTQEHFTPRVKPLYYVSEKHLLTYCVLRGIKTDFSECPYAINAYRMYMTTVLNTYEEAHPGTKKNILKTYLELREQFTESEEEYKEIEIDHKSASDGEDKPSKVHEMITNIKSILNK